MGVPGSVNALLAAGGPTQYKVERSLRFNGSADSAYLSRTPASAGNRKTFTWSGWVKKGANSSQNIGLFSAGTSAYYDGLAFGGNSTDTLYISFANSSGTNNDYYPALETTQVFRDPSAWYHIVVAVDTTQATASNRIKFYVNGTQITTFSATNYPAQDYQANFFNTTSTQYQGAGGGLYAGRFLNGYLADIHFIDGQALTPSSFGETNATTGQWVPKAYTGTYGTNGFKLTFSDNSNTTATTLGKDTSGNGNNFTPTNFSVTAGAGNDSLVDTPTSYGTGNSGGDVRGNYATFNPLLIRSTTTLSNGNLESIDSSSDAISLSTIGVSTGKWYWEITGLDITGSESGQRSAVGIIKNPQQFALNTYVGSNANGFGYYSGNGSKLTNGSGSSYGATWATNDVIGVALDLDNGTLVFYKNGTSQGTAHTSLNTGDTYFAAASQAGNGKVAINFGQRPFAYTAPSGFKALCDTNLAEGTITTSGTFTGNANADGPFIWLNGVPTAMTINSNAITFGTHADKLANGFKVRTNSTSYNTSGSNSYSITTTGAKFKYARAQANP